VDVVLLVRVNYLVFSFVGWRYGSEPSSGGNIAAQDLREWSRENQADQSSRSIKAQQEDPKKKN
jgi:hypothetical protein